MLLKQCIAEDMKAAMRAKEARRLSALRMLLAAIKQKEVDDRSELTDADVLGVVEKQIKQRRESIAQFQMANRADLVDAETFELTLLQGYLPQQLPDEELPGEVAKAIAETGASSLRDMGKVMGVLKTRLAGRADMAKVSAAVKAKLGC
jgi:uncharacterized protein YqeY